MARQYRALITCFILLLGRVAWAQETSPDVPSIIHKPFNPNEVVSLEVAQRFVTLIRLPEPIQEIFLGDPTQFKVEHSERNIYVKPSVRQEAQTNLVIHTQSQQLIILFLHTQREGSIAPPKNAMEHPRQLVYVLSFVPQRPSVLIPLRTQEEVLARPTRYEHSPSEPAESAAIKYLTGDDPAPLMESLLEETSHTTRVKYAGEGLQGAILKVVEQNNWVYIVFRLRNRTPKTLTLLDPQVMLESEVPKGMFRHGHVGAAELMPRHGLYLEKKVLNMGEEITGIILVERPAALDSNQRIVFTVRESNKADKPLRLPAELGNTILNSVE